MPLMRASRAQFRVAGLTLATLVAAVLLMALPATVFAWGEVFVPASSWNGVDVYSNSPAPVPWDAEGDSGWGVRWQCVELPQRFYNQKGWVGATHWPVDYAYQMYDVAPGLGLTRQDNGSISALGWGDLVIWLGERATPTTFDTGGHVAVVTAVNGSSVTIVEQNGLAAERGTRTIALTGGTLSDGRGEIRGVIKCPGSAPPSTPTVTIELSGLTAGALKLGQVVTASGTVTPVSLAGTRVVLSVQMKTGTTWVKVKTTSASSRPVGKYRWKYAPAVKGAYRMRAQVAATATHAAATTKWLAFTVEQPAAPPTLLTGGPLRGRFAVRPGTIWTGAGVTVFHYIGPSPGKGGSIRWSEWTASEAHGVGTLWINDCVPDTARGTWHGYRATIDASRVRDGRYTRMTVRFRENGEPRTWKSVLSKTLWGGKWVAVWETDS